MSRRKALPAGSFCLRRKRRRRQAPPTLSRSARTAHGVRALHRLRQTAAGQAAERVKKDLALLGGQFTQDVVTYAVEHLVRGLDRQLARVGHDDHTRAAVGARGTPLGQPGRLELVARHHHRRLVESDETRDLGLSVLAGQRRGEHGVGPGRDAQVLERGTHLRHQVVAGAREEPAQISGEGGRSFEDVCGHVTRIVRLPKIWEQKIYYVRRRHLTAAAYSIPRRSRSCSSPRQWRRTRTESARWTCSPSSCSITRRAAIPIALTMCRPAPIRIRFWDSVSARMKASTRTGSPASTASSTTSTEWGTSSRVRASTCSRMSSGSHTRSD